MYSDYEKDVSRSGGCLCSGAGPCCLQLYYKQQHACFHVFQRGQHQRTCFHLYQWQQLSVCFHSRVSSNTGKQPKPAGHAKFGAPCGLFILSPGPAPKRQSAAKNRPCFSALRRSSAKGHIHHHHNDKPCQHAPCAGVRMLAQICLGNQLFHHHINHGARRKA